MNIDLVSFVGKLILEYENNFHPLHYLAEKRDGKFSIVSMNSKLKELTGFTEDYCGTPLEEISYFKKEAVEFLNAVFNRVWSGKTAVYYAVPHLNRNIYLLVLAKPVQDEKGECLFIDATCACVSRDDMESLVIPFIPVREYQSFE
ncbi:hypothetical protein GKZ89_13240 [Bacillus mangrovi]|uniref:PAS domain-containing protein n=1 Tax=Metabacillus mangrovi TaxID=1491830 RepID=A0A7X2S655_9BACI|nr:hypothetical protein [Metabacillus mangrovi]MTH54369.1 hypothetical protein [Metabacillus mangrovi]